MCEHNINHEKCNIYFIAHSGFIEGPVSKITLQVKPANLRFNSKACKWLEARPIPVRLLKLL